MSELIVHQGFNEDAAQEFRENGLVIVSGLLRPEVAHAAVSEGSDLFSRPRRLDTTSGQVADLHSGSSLEHTVLGIVLHHADKAGQTLGLSLGPEANLKPVAQMIELSDAAGTSYQYYLGHSSVAALVGLEGGMQLRVNSARFGQGPKGQIEPGTIAFLKQRNQESPYSLRVGRDSRRATGLLIAGSNAHPDTV